jgi:hypothetical protein
VDTKDGAGDFALSDGFIQARQEHQNDGGFLEGAEKQG